MSDFSWVKMDEPIGQADRGLVVRPLNRQLLVISSVGIENILALIKDDKGHVVEMVFPKSHIYSRMASNGEGGEPCAYKDISIAEELTNYYRRRI